MSLAHCTQPNRLNPTLVLRLIWRGFVLFQRAGNGIENKPYPFGPGSPLGPVHIDIPRWG